MRKSSTISPPTPPPSLLIDDRDFGALDALDDSHFRLDSDQTTRPATGVNESAQNRIHPNGQHLPLSSAGSREVLGKMDAFQRRTGTPMRCWIKAMPATMPFCQPLPPRKLSPPRFSITRSQCR
ncbi:DUF1176 domain-containing protein [Klebsiella pneumoniae subsp. pneumoniae]|nr:DUF1176 domain-containing protein [Klebsiella pneumoniae subsp. pneumoniae]